MHILITNIGTVPVPFSSGQDKGFANLLQPQEPQELDSAAVTVANVGDNPSAREELTEGLKNFVVQLKKLVTLWREKTAQQADDSETVQISLHNKGTNGLRVLLGSNMNEIQVSPGTVQNLTALGYIEIRELGV